MLFKDRQDAGKKLAEKLKAYKGQQDIIVLALPRGGIPVGFEIAKSLEVPLDIFIVRKLGVPGHEELAMGAIADGGIIVLNEEIIQQLGITQVLIDRITQDESKEVARRESLYRRGRPAYKLGGKTIIVVDDGLATGASMRAALIAVKEKKPRKIIAAVPVGAAETCKSLRTYVDELVCLLVPPSFGAVGSWYEDFSQTTDAEVESLLDSAARNERIFVPDADGLPLPVINQNSKESREIF